MKISKNFKREEFACGCGCGFDVVDVELLAILEMVRKRFGKPVTITSGPRCDKHDNEVQKKAKKPTKRSTHRLGKAADFKVKDVPPVKVYEYLCQIVPDHCGIGLYSSWVHLDVRSKKARWQYG